VADKFTVRYEGTSAFVTANRSPQQVQVILECPDGLAEGADVRVSVSTFHTVSFRESHLASTEVENGSGAVVVGHGVPRHWTDMTRGGVGPAGGGIVGRPVGEVHLAAVQVRRPLSPGARLVLNFDLLLSVHSDIQGTLRTAVRQPLDEEFLPVGSPFQLTNSPGDPKQIEVRLKPVPNSDGKTRATIFLTDEWLNPIPQGGSIELDAGGVDGLPARVTVGQGESLIFDELSVSGDGGPVRITARAPHIGAAAQSAPALGKRIGADGHYFGTIHYHTRLSVDGDRDPAASYAYVRDVLNLDVVAMADHAPPGPYWEECLAVNEQFNEDGKFVAIPGWESSTAYGHANLYMRSPDVDAGPWWWDPDRNPSELTWDRDVIVVPHHTNHGQAIKRGQHRRIAEGIYWGKYDWTYPNERVRLVEMVQQRGSFEADQTDPYWRILDGGQSASVRDALRLGYRIGFVAGTDNHEGHPTQGIGKYSDLTCFRAPELTREAIWQAMDQRRTYATTGAAIIADFSVNGYPSGTEGSLSEGEDVHFSAALHGTAPIEVVEIISNDVTVWQSKPKEWDCELDHIAIPALPGGARSAYYYLRLRQVDGHIAWLSPVWLDLAS